MKLNLSKILILLVIITLIIGCSRTPDKEIIDKKVELKIIAKTIDSCIGWVKNKDLDLLYNIVANDSNYMSVHPTSRVVKGFEHFKQSAPFWMSPDFQYVKHEIKDLTINLSQSGDIAWFYCILNDMNTWKGQPANWENTRWTGVLEKRDNKWVIVQQHFSFAQE